MQVTVDVLQRALGDSVYRVERELGAGGMATVFLAEDVKHGRRVAIKVLRPELAAVVGAERFLSEIRTTASLQHPHILPLHDSGQADGLLYYVMPFVSGESLRDRLRRERQLPVDEAVRIAREVASGLDYAHRHGVIHRDIKPENILLHDGQALVADFGIAFALHGSGDGRRMTETGLIMGTPAYMSPEQAMGEREISPRSDIYALGCVLYEMLVGESPFTGPTVQAVVARVLTDDPEHIAQLRRSVPRHIDAAVHTALAKLPADRFATAGKFAEALLLSAGQEPTVALPAASRPPRPRLRMLIGIAGVAAVLGGVLIGREIGPSDPPLPAARVSLRIPAEIRLQETAVGAIAISPDGAMVAFSGARDGVTQLYLRRLDDLTTIPLPGTEGAAYPVFSPDGDAIDFFGSRGMLRAPVAGGAPLTSELPPANWDLLRLGPTDRVARGEGGALVRVRGAGPPVILARPDTTRGISGLIPLASLPGARLLVLEQQSATGHLAVFPLEGGALVRIFETPVVWAGYHDGCLAWLLSSGAQMAAAWDPARPTVVGASTVIAPNVRVGPGQPPQVAFSASGALAYIPSQPADLVRVDRAGGRRVISDRPRPFHNPRLSPDGRRVTVDLIEEQRDIWVVDLVDQTLSRLTFDGDGHDATWLPDGRAFLYASTRGGVSVGTSRRRVDGSGAVDSVWFDGVQTTIHAVSGSTAVGAYVSGNGSFDLVRIPLDGTEAATPLANAPVSESHPALSPDGRWLAYNSDESGRIEVYVRALDTPAGRVQVSRNGGQEPMWSRDGRELFYLTAESPAMKYSLGSVAAPGSMAMVSARIDVRDGPRVESRTTLFDASDFTVATPHANYDVTPDGAFLYVRTIPADEIIYVQRWTALVLDRVPGR